MDTSRATSSTTPRTNVIRGMCHQRDGSSSPRRRRASALGSDVTVYPATIPQYKLNCLRANGSCMNGYSAPSAWAAARPLIVAISCVLNAVNAPQYKVRVGLDIECWMKRISGTVRAKCLYKQTMRMSFAAPQKKNSIQKGGGSNSTSQVSHKPPRMRKLMPPPL